MKKTIEHPKRPEQPQNKSDNIPHELHRRASILARALMSIKKKPVGK